MERFNADTMMNGTLSFLHISPSKSLMHEATRSAKAYYNRSIGIAAPHTALVQVS